MIFLDVLAWVAQAVQWLLAAAWWWAPSVAAAVVILVYWSRPQGRHRSGGDGES
ncbi:hypothetical protein ACFY0G_02015 [Streptomyces sp. NPDC001552]|uniref:hypothetical protein n=1 Tax=Streptomyces sp. NPDC001552 TaxID=3364587 RepID=UPI003686DFDF